VAMTNDEIRMTIRMSKYPARMSGDLGSHGFLRLRENKVQLFCLDTTVSDGACLTQSGRLYRRNDIEVRRGLDMGFFGDC